MTYIIQRLLSGTKNEEDALWEDEVTLYGEPDAVRIVNELREEHGNQVYRIVISYKEKV